MNTATATEDYKKDAQGRLVPLSMIRPIDLARDSLVLEIFAKASALSEQVSTFRSSVFDDVAAFVQLSNEKYGVKIGGDKGNVSLTSFDGRYKVLRATQDTLFFDERLQAAKVLIDECARDWSEGAKQQAKVLITHAFRLDKSGNISVPRVLELRRLPFDDEAWLVAMQAVSDALQVAGSKAYVRIYERIGTSGKFRQISLDMAGD